MSDVVLENNTNDEVAANVNNVEQITKEPVVKSNPMKIKDPKKIAAGKKLAAYNKKAKEKQKLTQNEPIDSSENESGGSFLPQISLTTIIAIIGLGLSGIDLFFRYKNQESYLQKNDKVAASLKNEEYSNWEKSQQSGEINDKVAASLKNEIIGGME